MKQINDKPDKGDPSDIQQRFTGVNLQLLCCRFWWLENWEFKELSYPYWRIYHNENSGATIIYNEVEYNLEPGKIAIIAPNTPFSTRLYNNPIPESEFILRGARIREKDLHCISGNKQRVNHLFIHFNLGSFYDNPKPGVFLFKVNPIQIEQIKIITQAILSNYVTFTFQMEMYVKSLVTGVLAMIHKNTWTLPSRDTRIMNTLAYIDNNILTNLSNAALASRIGLATNSFTRLFTRELKVPPQQYVKKSKVHRASVLLHHTQKSIDNIASSSGFTDRYHFSRVFKQVYGISPARYRKAHTIG